MQGASQSHLTLFPAPLIYFLISSLNFTFQLYLIFSFPKCHAFVCLKGFENASLPENIALLDFFTLITPWLIWDPEASSTPSPSKSGLFTPLLFSHCTSAYPKYNSHIILLCFCSIFFSLDSKVLEDHGYVLLGTSSPSHMVEGRPRIRHSLWVRWMNQ